MPADLLADLRAVMAEATPGPWTLDEDRILLADGNDADAIVALRNAWPALEAALAQAEADRAELERLRRVEAAARGFCDAGCEEGHPYAFLGCVSCEAGCAAEEALRAALRGER